MESNQAISDYLARSTPYKLVGLRPVGSDAYGALPVTSHAAGDNGASPWHPDSPIFWVAVLGVLVLVGAVGVTSTGRAGPFKASVSAGK